MRRVRVFCPVCDGASADHRLPPCDYCNNVGHFNVDCGEDGTIPATHPDSPFDAYDSGTPVRLYSDETEAIFGTAIRLNPLILLSDAPKA